MSKGLLIILSGPSGVGKGTVCTALRPKMPELVYSVSATTRSPRAGEEDGVNYFFKSKDEFMAMIEADQLLEYAEYVGNYYGTPRDFVERTLNSGKDIILEIEVQGALKVKEKFPEHPDVIDHRMTVAEDEINLMQHYDYAVVNDEIDLACKRIESIIIAEHCKVR